MCGNLLLWSFSCMKNVKSVHLKISKQIAIMASRYEVCGNLLMWSFSSIKNVKTSSFENLEANWANMAAKYEVCGNLLLWWFSLMKNVKGVHLKILKQIGLMWLPNMRCVEIYFCDDLAWWKMSKGFIWKYWSKLG